MNRAQKVAATLATDARKPLVAFIEWVGAVAVVRSSFANLGRIVRKIGRSAPREILFFTVFPEADPDLFFFPLLVIDVFDATSSEGED